MATLLSSQGFICRQEGVLDLRDGKSCWVPLEGSAFGPGKPCGGSEGAQVIQRAHQSLRLHKGFITHKQCCFVGLQ